MLDVVVAAVHRNRAPEQNPSSISPPGSTTGEIFTRPVNASRFQPRKIMHTLGGIRPRDLLAVIGGFLLLVCFAIISLVLYRSFLESSATPPLPAFPGSAMIAFDRRGVPAVVRLDVSPREPTELHFTISINDDYRATDEVIFVLDLAGLISKPPDLPGLGDAGDNGCTHSIYVIPDLGSKCTRTSIPRSGFIGNSVDPEPQLAVEGKILRNSSGKMFVQVNIGTFDLRYDTSAGKRMYFALPETGTTYLRTPIGSTSPTPLTLSLDYGVGKVLYPPYSITLITSYRELKPSERLDIVVPSTYDPGILLWIENDHSRLRPRGSLVDTAIEDRSQSKLFLIGVIIGLIGTAFPLIAETTWKSAKRARRSLKGSRVPAKLGEAEQGERAVEVIAGPAQALGDVGVAGSAEHGDDGVS
jgi:hypothetical protein